MRKWFSRLDLTSLTLRTFRAVNEIPTAHMLTTREFWWKIFGLCLTGVGARNLLLYRATPWRTGAKAGICIVGSGREPQEGRKGLKNVGNYHEWSSAMVRDV